MFNPAWIARIEDLRVVRFMDWMATNHSPLSAWSDRPRPDDYTFAWRGAPVEVMVALANEIGADPWFTLPHQATDEHIRAFAEFARDHLDPRRKAYVEYSNEIWNWIFGQTHWALAEAKRRWGADAGGDAWMQFAGMRAAETAAIWKDVFGAEAEDRLVAVVATQTGWLGLEQPLLEAPLWVAEDPDRNRPPASYFDAYAVTGYFGHQLAAEKAPDVLRWIAEGRAAAERDAAAKFPPGPARKAEVERHRFDLATARAAADLRDGSVTGLPEGSVAHLVDELFTYHADVAERHGLDLVMYEGGTHVVASPEWHEDADLTAFLMHLNYSPEMADLYATLLDGWRAAGGGLFNAFVDVAGPRQVGKLGRAAPSRRRQPALGRPRPLQPRDPRLVGSAPGRRLRQRRHAARLGRGGRASRHGIHRHAARRRRRRPLDRRRRRRPAARRRRHRRRPAARRARRLPLLARRRRRPRRRPRRHLPPRRHRDDPLRR